MSTDHDLIDRLASHRTVGVAPREELAWLAAHGQLKPLVIGEEVFPPPAPLPGLMIVFSGHFGIRVDRGAGPRMVLEWRAGDVSGVLPYSRMVSAPGHTEVIEPGEGLVIGRELFPELTRACPEVTATLVHVMVDRARAFNTSDMHDEKMMSLGRMAAGLAHELNNPASAAAHSSRLLLSALNDAESATRTLGGMPLSDAQRAAVDQVRAACLAADETLPRSPLEHSDREEELGDWLVDHDADEALAGPLADTAVTIDSLETLSAGVTGAALDASLRWIVANYVARTLAQEVNRAVSRIYDLVGAVKRFTYMDRQAAPESVNVSQGLRDTIAIHSAKARQKSVTVAVELEAPLPDVMALGGELNQIWSNLLDNSLDAVEPGGHVTISARREHDHVVVRVIDDGPGIPSEVLPKIFDAFFTTKDVGQGTGLGLDIAQRLARRHKGEIVVDTRPGRTEFRVMFPVARAPSDGGSSRPALTVPPSALR